MEVDKIKKAIVIIVAIILLTVVCGTVTADENYNDNSWEGDSPNAQGDPQDPDDTGGTQQRAEPRTRNKDN